MGTTVKSQTALLFGLGYTAKALVPLLKARGYRVVGTVRTLEKAVKLSRAMGIEVIPFSGFMSRNLKSELSKATIIISSIAPSDDGTDPVIAAVPDIGKLAKASEWAGYLSATSVYGDRQGRWTFEDELLRPKTQRGRNRISTELAWLESGLPVHVFRLAGIYGPVIHGQARNAFKRLRTSLVKAVVKPDHVVNRIHVGDIARAVMASIDKPDPVQVYNISDGNPAPPQDVLAFAADLIGEPRPERIDFETAEMSDMARSFYLEAKRIDCSRAQNDLEWTPRFATYRDGLCQIYRTQKFGSEAFLLAGHVIAPEANLEAILQELPGHRDATRAEPGCLRFDVFQDLEDKCKLHVFEVFKSEKDFRLHKKRMQGTAWVKASQNLEKFYTVSKKGGA